MSKISRREFVETTGAGLAVASAAPLSAQNGHTDAPPAPHTTVKLTVNGVEHRTEVEDRWTLVELLRDHLKLTGTKVGCDRGECGACTVLLDGKPIYSCSYLAVWANTRPIPTVEGLGRKDRPD